MKELSCEAIAQLRYVQEQIRKEPESFYMPDWIQVKGKSLHRNHSNVCKTACCIAGHIVTRGKDLENMSQDDLQPLYSNAKSLAIDTLGITSDEAEHLFIQSDWPSEFSGPYYVATVQGQHDVAAEIACKRIDYFIENRC